MLYLVTSSNNMRIGIFGRWLHMHTVDAFLNTHLYIGRPAPMLLSDVCRQHGRVQLADTLVVCND